MARHRNSVDRSARLPTVSLALALACLSGTAAAQEEPEAPRRSLAEAVSVEEGAACLTRDALVEHVSAWLEHDALDPRLSIVVEEAGAAAGFVVIHGEEARAARRFESLPPRCADRRAVVSLAIAIAVDSAILDALVPSASGAAAAPAEAAAGPGLEEVAPSAPPDAIEPPPPEVPSSDGAASDAVHLELAAEAQVNFEVLPTVGAAWQLQARLVIERVVEIGLGLFATSVGGAPLGEGSVSAQLAGGRLDLCLRRAVAPWLLLRGCGGVQIGAAMGRGHDVRGAREAQVPFANAVARVGLAFRLADFLAIEVGVDGLVALLRPRFDLAGAEGVPSQSVLLPLGGGAATLGLTFAY